MAHLPQTSTNLETAAKTAFNDATQEVTAQAKTAVKDAAGEAHAASVREADRTAEALNRASGAFDPNSLQAAAIGQIAQTVDAVANHLKGHSPESLLDDVAVFARKNPALFLGGAALAGFAAMRFLKASPEVSASQDAASDPWSGHLARPTTSAMPHANTSPMSRGAVEVDQ